MSIQITCNNFSNQPNVPITNNNQISNINKLILNLRDLAFLTAARLNCKKESLTTEEKKDPVAVREFKPYDCRLSTILPTLIVSSVKTFGLSQYFKGYNYNPHYIPREYADKLNEFAKVYCELKDNPKNYQSLINNVTFVNCQDDGKIFLPAIIQGLETSFTIPNDLQMRKFLMYLLDPKVKSYVQGAINLWVGFVKKNMGKLSNLSVECDEGAVAVKGLKSYISYLDGSKEGKVLINANWIAQNAKTWFKKFSTGLNLHKKTTLFNGLNILQVALIMEKQKLAGKILEVAKYESCEIRKQLRLNHTSPVNLATLIGNFDLTKKIMELNSNNNNSLNNIQRRSFVGPLHIAAVTGDEEITKKLISLKINVNAKGVCQETPLYTAVTNGNFGVAKILLHAGARAKTGKPYQIALASDNYALVNLLFEHGGVPKTISKSEGEYKKALNIPHLGRLRFLKKINLVPPHINYLLRYRGLNWSPITSLNETMYLDLVDHLESNGFDCFHLALWHERYDLYELLLRKGKVLSRDTVDRVFNFASDHKNFDNVHAFSYLKKLLELGLEPNQELYGKILNNLNTALNSYMLAWNNKLKMQLQEAVNWLRNYFSKPLGNQTIQPNNKRALTDSNNGSNKKPKLN
jgi:ankyrin repeat protein